MIKLKVEIDDKLPVETQKMVARSIERLIGVKTCIELTEEEDENDKPEAND